MKKLFAAWLAFVLVGATATYALARGAASNRVAVSLGNHRACAGSVRGATTCPYPAMVLSDSPLFYYRLGDMGQTDASQTVATNLGSQPSTNAIYKTGVNPFTGLGAAGGIFHDGDAALNDPHVTNGCLSNSGSTPTTLTDVTWEAWVKPNANAHTYMTLLSWSSSGPGLYLHSNTKLDFYISGDADSPAGVVASGTWQHVVAARAGTTVTYYVNGVSVGTATQSGSFGTQSGTPLVACDNFSGDDYDGIIDDVAIYGSALSAARVLAHWNCGNAGSC